MAKSWDSSLVREMLSRAEGGGQPQVERRCRLAAGLGLGQRALGGGREVRFRQSLITHGASPADCVTLTLS